MATFTLDSGLVDPGEAISRRDTWLPDEADTEDQKLAYFLADIAAQIARNAYNLFPEAETNTPLRVQIGASDVEVYVAVGTVEAE